MSVKFRIWMPLVAVFIVMLSVALTLFYGIPVARARLEDYAQNTLQDQADAVAGAVDPDTDPRPLLRQAAAAAGGQALLVEPGGRVVENQGPNFLDPESRVPGDVAAQGSGGDLEDLSVSVAPVVSGRGISGSVVLASETSGNVVYRIFLRSGLEAAGLAALVGGGLMLLLAMMLGRRVGRLMLGARSMEKGDFSYRLRPGFDDELGELAKTFNAMAVRLEAFFVRLKEKNATLDTILSNLSEGVLTTDGDGRVTFMNPVCRSMMDLSGEPSLELPAPWADFDLRMAVTRCLKENACSEARVRSADTFLHVKVARLSGEDGTLVIIRDLSEGRRLELEQQRFLSNAAHEFKTPITSILGAAELLEEGVEDPDARNRFLGYILEEARRLHRLSDTMLRLARTGLDQREPDLRTVELADMAREMAERARALADRSGITLRVEGEGGWVVADGEWLEQALMILLNNAIKYSEGGGEVKFRVAEGSVTVEDTGAGVSETDLPYVFERFYRGKGEASGFGLGLAICKELVERMDGNIFICSREGSGTSVKIELPEA